MTGELAIGLMLVWASGVYFGLMIDILWKRTKQDQK